MSTRAIVLAFLVACGAPRPPATTDDLEVPRERAVVEPPADAMVDAAVDAPTPDSAVRSSDAACEDDPAAKQACESMGATFAPRMVVPCHRGAGAPLKAVPRCMCVDTSKPRVCP